MWTPSWLARMASRPPRRPRRAPMSKLLSPLFFFMWKHMRKRRNALGVPLCFQSDRTNHFKRGVLQIETIYVLRFLFRFSFCCCQSPLLKYETHTQGRVVSRVAQHSTYKVTLVVACAFFVVVYFSFLKLLKSNTSRSSCHCFPLFLPPTQTLATFCFCSVFVRYGTHKHWTMTTRGWWRGL